MKRTSKWISSITLVASFYQVSDGRVTRLVNFRMATPWPWTPRATSSSLRSASEMRQVIEFRNSGLWRAGRWPESALEFVLYPAEILSRAHDLSLANVSAPLFRDCTTKMGCSWCTKVAGVCLWNPYPLGGP